MLVLHWLFLAALRKRFKLQWVYFVRSWTGHHIFAIKLTGSSAGGAKVTDSWVNADPQQYRSSSKKTNVELLNGIIKSRFEIEINT